MEREREKGRHGSTMSLRSSTSLEGEKTRTKRARLGKVR